MLGALLTISVLTAVPEPEPPPLVPVYVPRSIKLGVFINPPLVTPQFRLQWEGALVDQPRNMLVWTASIGSGAGLNPQAPMTAHFQHVILAGLGFRSDRPLLHWGFSVLAGPVWYRAAYAPGAIFRFENRVLGYIEGKAQLGLRVLPHLRISVYFGYASPFTFQIQYPGNTFVGGFDTGLLVDWR